MICNHDPLYKRNNESAGGAGCPMCNAERIKPRRVLRVAKTATENSVMIDADFAAMSDIIAAAWPTLPEIEY